MEFSSLLFIFAFLPVSLTVFYLTPKKYRSVSLLILSLIFCGMTGLYFLALMTCYTIINYAVGLGVGHTKKIKPLSAVILAIGILLNIFVFLIFRTKIFSGVSDILRIADIIIPIGLSFTVLSGTGYIIDIYRKKIPPEHNIARFMLYIMLFTKLPAGPVISYNRYQKLLKKSRNCGVQHIGRGIGLFVTGLAKKILFADNLYLLYSAVSVINVKELSALSAWLGAIAYILCLYFTLSGLSDMGAGLSSCFGFTMPSSFNYPCFSAGINDFCSKWHITVVKWFKLNIYQPISSGTDSKHIRIVGFILMWCLIGVWYEFSITNLIWGLIIGTAFAVEQLVRDKRTLKATAVFYTIIVLSFSTVFFFGDNITYSLQYVFAMLGGNNNIADTTSFYLLRSYIAVLLVAIYFATDLFRNIVMRSKKRIIRNTANLFSPFIMMILLVICTAIISYNGVSGPLLINL